MGELTPQKYRELFKLRAQGELEDMECTKSLYKIMEPIFKPGMKVLEVPAGSGHYYRKIKELGKMEFYGVDLDEPAIEMAKDVWKNDSNAKWFVQDASKMDFEDNFFDIVFCYNLLLHLHDYKDPMKEMFRVTKKYLIVRSLFDEQASSKTLEAHPDYRKVYKTGTIYYNTYPRDEIKKFVEKLGPCKITFMGDNLEIPKEHLEKQEKALKVDSEEFAKGEKGKKQDWKGLKLNYEVMLIEKI